MITFKRAQETVVLYTLPLDGVEKINLESCEGRVLAGDVRAEFYQPPFTNSAMDGFAVRSQELEGASPDAPISVEIQSFQSAGSAFLELKPYMTCDIATGAPLPYGADAVVMKEKFKTEGVRAIFYEAVKPGTHVREKGSDVREGEILLRRGEKISPKSIGLLASFGVVELPVVRQPKIFYVATGDEIVAVGEKRAENQIYNSNARSLRALVCHEGCTFTDLGVFKDDEEELKFCVERILEDAPDIFILNGGISVGKRDYVRKALESLNVEIIFHKVAIKPGKPILFGRLNKTLIFGLPGNPFSTQVAFYQFVYPAIQKMVHGRNYFLKEEKAYLGEPLVLDARHLIVPAVKRNILGVVEVSPLKESSGSVAALSKANCFISIPEGEGILDKDSLVSIQVFGGL